jgi:hypothetical protein
MKMGHNQRLLGKFPPKYAALALTNFVERGLTGECLNNAPTAINYL